MPRTAILLTFFLFTGCAYRFGLSPRALPGGYTQVAIPIFKNGTQEVGVEPIFTNSLIRRFHRSQVAKVTDKDAAPVTLEGKILKIDTISEVAKDTSGLQSLPADTVLTTQYRLVVSVRIILRRKSDEKEIWKGDFRKEIVYLSPVIGTSVVNSANATYNQSARMEYISRLADQMMVEAHDRITENF